MLRQRAQLCQQLADNARRFRSGCERADFALLAAENPIVRVMMEDARLTQRTAERLLGE